ncbi:helix-turn-helix domain-containing protein [Altererythrobacter sp. MF3-039]|uniref:helix-turn-helix domain-containing protein n=1 Tax=Altererythrobacter sp. MF3-039 TaxID=3252901 RepID=UPI00390C62B1
MSEESVNFAEHESNGLRLRLAGPPPDLAPYLSGYYRTEVAQGTTIEDWLPPEEANVRTGTAEIYEASIGEFPLATVPPAVLSGPTDKVTHLRIRNGKFWGIGFTPAGWARFIRIPASTMANRFSNIGETPADRSLADLLESLREDGDDLPNAVGRINATLRQLMGARPANESTIHAVHMSTLSPEATSVPPIAAMAGMSTRTFERFCKRHFGFTGGVLLRRQRFLRSLGKYMLDPSMRWISALDTHYADQAHFIRDFRAAMNMTPSDYAALAHPLVGAAVSVTNMGGGVAHQALYKPAGVPDR